MSSSVPADMINLRLILVSGKTKEFLFSPNDSAADIAKHVYDNWPMDWEEEQVSSPNILRLIYQGRFLHGNVTLGGMKVIFIIHVRTRRRAFLLLFFKFFLQCSKYYFPAQNHDVICCILFSFGMEWRIVSYLVFFCSVMTGC
ncbi:ubiquitin-like protein 3 [Numida meleagris]|uniref:ubiquitin-like protein 3 n=1 Tax=Numida meleagris TaxID=8996 RepID=UPI000B3D91E5|nr:ubiquitin-like protein 3 [Numida meleagris]